MAKIHRISGYVVDIDEDFTKADLQYSLGALDMITHQLHVESADIGEWEDDNPLNYHNCDLAECEKWFHKEPTKNIDTRQIEVGAVYRHFKGEIVKVIAIARDTEYTNHLSVIYVHIDHKEVWSRPYDMFISEVDHEKYPKVTQKYRFEKVEG